jgi:hypothetical protein
VDRVGRTPSIATSRSNGCGRGGVCDALHHKDKASFQGFYAGMFSCVATTLREASDLFSRQASRGRARLVYDGAKLQSGLGQSTPLNGNGNGFARRAASKVLNHGHAKPKSTQ